MFKVLISMLILTSCSKFVQMTDGDYYYEQLNTKSDAAAQILFSHNINGETHPCGCRNFPLGGLVQVHAYMDSTASMENQIYVDTGDALFESVTVPKFIQKSSIYTAHKIAESFDLLGLKFFTPGDQDFAMGEDFLVEISNKHKFNFLITNSQKEMKIKHIKHAYIKSADRNLFFLGIVSPDLLSLKNQSLFSNPSSAIKNELKIIEEKYPNIKDKTFILLSHSGLDADRKFAKELPLFDWIIGAHTQSYLRYSEDIGQTQLVQVLSRNHYLGEIRIANNPKAKSAYKLIETRDELKELTKKTMMKDWLTDYKQNLDDIHKKEGASSLFSEDDTNQKITTYTSCSECHEKQVNFWQGTAHSIAYTTLIAANESHNPKCIKCHSVGYREKGGFNHPKNIVLSEKKEFNIDKYWQDFLKGHKIDHPVRGISAQNRQKISKSWIKFDSNQMVTANHANVQCLNCHNQTGDHPFNISSESKTKYNYQAKCLSCHNSDQSPEWYNKDSKGLATSLNDEYFAKKLKEVSCPKLEKE